MGAGASTPHTISISPTGKVVAKDIDGAFLVLEGNSKRAADVFEKALEITMRDDCGEDFKISVNELKRLALTMTLDSSDRILWMENQINILEEKMNVDQNKGKSNLARRLSRLIPVLEDCDLPDEITEEYNRDDTFSDPESYFSDADEVKSDSKDDNGGYDAKNKSKKRYVHKSTSDDDLYDSVKLSLSEEKKADESSKSSESTVCISPRSSQRYLSKTDEEKVS